MVVVDVGEALVRLSEWLWAKRIEPVSIQVGGESLEAVFLRLTRETDAGNGASAGDALGPDPQPPGKQA
jgi:hypothetical protein